MLFHNAMVLSPNSEVYFLDTLGNVIGFDSSAKGISQKSIPLQPVIHHIFTGGKDYIKSVDPRDAGRKKIFSAAAVTRDGHTLGYIYVILSSTEARQVARMLFGNHAILLAVIVIICILILSLAVSFAYVRRIQRRFDHIVDVLDRFQQGMYDARFRAHPNDGLAPIKNAFNKMADLLVSKIDHLTKSESDRKAFIAGVAHDLRNPLSIASGYAETLLIKKNLSGLQHQEYTNIVPAKNHSAGKHGSAAS